MNTYTTPAITITGVSKAFRQSFWERRKGVIQPPALYPLDLTIHKGTMVGLVGINGSGKSTLIRILATLTTPDTGHVEIFGHDVEKHAGAVRKHINRVSVDAAFFKQMTPWENLVYSARLYGHTGPSIRDEAYAALKRLNFPEQAITRPMHTLSRGQQQKVAIVRSLLSAPSLLLLDEPTTGLDPRSKLDVQTVISELHQSDGVTILLCTHDLQEAEALCSRIIMLDQGRIIADGTPTQLRTQIGGNAETTLDTVFIKLTGHQITDEIESIKETTP